MHCASIYRCIRTYIHMHFTCICASWPIYRSTSQHTTNAWLHLVTYGYLHHWPHHCLTAPLLCICASILYKCSLLTNKGSRRLQTSDHLWILGYHSMNCSRVFLITQAFTAHVRPCSRIWSEYRQQVQIYLDPHAITVLYSTAHGLTLPDHITQNVRTYSLVTST